MNLTKVSETGQNQTYHSEYVNLADDLYSFKVQSFITFLLEVGLIKSAKQIREIDSVTICSSQKNGLNPVFRTHYINFS